MRWSDTKWLFPSIFHISSDLKKKEENKCDSDSVEAVFIYDSHKYSSGIFFLTHTKRFYGNALNDFFTFQPVHAFFLSEVVHSVAFSALNHLDFNVIPINWDRFVFPTLTRPQLTSKLVFNADCLQLPFAAIHQCPWTLMVPHSANSC